jgi:hypothetical protein
MRTLRRAIVVAVLTVTCIAGVASAASAQDRTPYDMPSLGPAAAAIGISGAAVGWRFDTQAVVVAVPDEVNVGDQQLRKISEVVWNTEPVRFRTLVVQHPSGVLDRWSYTEMHQAYGPRPPGLDRQSLKQMGKSFENLGSTVLGLDRVIDLIKIFAFVVVVFVVAIMLVATLFVFVNTQLRRATGTGSSGVSRPWSHPA